MARAGSGFNFEVGELERALRKFCGGRCSAFMQFQGATDTACTNLRGHRSMQKELVALVQPWE